MAFRNPDVEKWEVVCQLCVLVCWLLHRPAPLRLCSVSFQALAGSNDMTICVS